MVEHVVLGERDAGFCLVQPVDAHDAAILENEYSHIAEACPGEKILLAALKVDDWNGDLSPWEADPVSLRFKFSGNAAKTLDHILKGFLPMLKRDYLSSPDKVQLIIGGYSLAGLFALWASYNTDAFAACAAVSPSLWFPGWMDYAAARQVKTGAVYLSLGDKEEKVKHPVMRTVGDCIRRQKGLLEGIPSVLEWNPGTHFTDPDLRMANGFAWCVETKKHLQNLQVLDYKCAP